jgi:hypothetical protein
VLVERVAVRLLTLTDAMGLPVETPLVVDFVQAATNTKAAIENKVITKDFFI